MPQAIFSASDICVTDSLRLADSSKNASSWLWSFGDGSTSANQNPVHKYFSAGTYMVKLIVSNSNGCKDSVIHTITVDSTYVWPGDANADKIVDNVVAACRRSNYVSFFEWRQIAGSTKCERSPSRRHVQLNASEASIYLNKDILAIGIAYSDTGSARTDTSTMWKANLVKNWSNNFSSGANVKHADCDGNGLINYADTFAVTKNYTKTHLKKDNTSRGKNTDPILKIDIQNDSLKVGDTLVAYIILGENALPAKDVYGLAFSLDYNRDYFNFASIDYTDCWLGSNNDNLLAYSNQTNRLDIAITKTDHQNKTGFGRLAAVKLVLKKDIPAQINLLKLEIGNSYIISSDEKEIEVNIEADSVQIYRQPNSISFVNYQLPEIKIYPNPFYEETIMEYTLSKASKVSITSFDISGRAHILMQETTKQAGKNSFTINAHGLHSGIYIIKIETNGLPAYKKIVKVK